MSDLEAIRLAVRQFTAEREWQQFHSPKNLAMALAGETGELVSLFQWLDEDESRNLPAARLASPRTRSPMCRCTWSRWRTS